MTDQEAHGDQQMIRSLGCHSRWRTLWLASFHCLGWKQSTRYVLCSTTHTITQQTVYFLTNSNTWL